MTKNSVRYPNGELADGLQSPMKNNQTVAVISESGGYIGQTYPKRAKGLIKKGRAELLSDNVIRMIDSCPTDISISEENIMDDLLVTTNDNINANDQSAAANEVLAASAEKAPERKHEYILFNTRDYFANPDIRSNVCGRYMYQLADGSFEEIYTISDWIPSQYSHFGGIYSKRLPISKDTDYTLVFWLNGGENDRKDEICQLLVIYTDGTAERATSEEYHQNYKYRLNRNGVRPIKTIDGWYLFAIDLPGSDKSFVEFRFEAQGAPTYLRAAAPPECYEDMPDTPDEFADYRPQRHNIFFEDGWPDDDPDVHGNWYSTAAIKRRLENPGSNSIQQQRQSKGKVKSITITVNGQTIDVLGEFSKALGCVESYDLESISRELKSIGQDEIIAISTTCRTALYQKFMEAANRHGGKITSAAITLNGQMIDVLGELNKALGCVESNDLESLLETLRSLDKAEITTGLTTYLKTLSQKVMTAWNLK